MNKRVPLGAGEHKASVFGLQGERLDAGECCRGMIHDNIFLDCTWHLEQAQLLTTNCRSLVDGHLFNPSSSIQDDCYTS